MSLQRMEHQGAAPTTGVGSNFSAVATSFTLVSGTGYPTGATGPFVLKIDENTPSEEKILCSSRSGTTVTVSSSPAGRGFDGTTATSHSSGTANVEHCFSAAEADDDNSHIYDSTRDDHGQYLRADGTRTGATSQAQTFTDGVVVTSGGLTVSSGTTTASGGLAVSGNASVGGNPLVAFLGGAHQYRVQAASTPVSTNGSGQATITFPSTFGTIVSVVTSATVGNGGFAQTIVISQTASSFVVECLTSAGVLMTAASVSVNWIAIGF